MARRTKEEQPDPWAALLHDDMAFQELAEKVRAQYRADKEAGQEPLRPFYDPNMGSRFD